MNILMLGDVVGSIGCKALRNKLASIKKLKDIDICIANGENSADGNGILPQSAESLFTSGVDIITTGNHVFRRREIFDFLDENEFIVRPANYPACANGKGLCIYDMGKTIVGVINLMGVVYLEPLENPFRCLDKQIELAKDNDCKIILVDIHAEATAEKKALAYYVDGKVSAVVGTHTHTQTNDLQILENGTGFITDLGMCGPKNSVLGVKKELAIAKMKNLMPVRFENADGTCIINGAIFEIDEKTGNCMKTELISVEC